MCLQCLDQGLSVRRRIVVCQALDEHAQSRPFRGVQRVNRPRHPPDYTLKSMPRSRGCCLQVEGAAIGRATPTARRLVEASVSPNTRRAYIGTLRRLDAWLDGRELDDANLAAHLAELHDAGRASSSPSMAVAAACFRAKLAGQPTPAGERTARVLAGYRRTAGDRGRRQARPFGISDLAAVLATCHRPLRRFRLSTPICFVSGLHASEDRPPLRLDPDPECVAIARASSFRCVDARAGCF